MKESAEEKKLNIVPSINGLKSLSEETWQFAKAKKLADLESLFDNLGEGIVAFSLDLNVTDSNKVGKHIIENFINFYYDGKNYKLKDLLIIQEVFIKNTNSLALMETASYNLFGEKHIFNISASPIFSEAHVLTGACLILNDITESKKHTKELEDLISGLTHDLKTPLIAAEINFIHLINEDFGKISKEQLEILTLLNQNNTDALRFVKNLLAVFKYEAKVQKIILEPVELSELFKQVNSSIKSMLEEKKIDLIVSTSNFQFICDPFEIGRVLVNVLTNAISATLKGGRIELTAVKNEEGAVIFTIEDFGNGISEEDLPNLFKRFWQSSRSPNSSGLGLHLCKHILAAHGGKIRAESKLGKWTRITFEIPDLIA
jgi:signal transduction histidine kinase